MQGTVYGGQSPVVGATVTLYEAAAAGGTGQALVITYTNSDGSYSFPGVTSYGDEGACSSASSLVYLVASGGNPGAGSNSAINLMAAVGACGSLPSYVVINELTTVAAVYALNGFAYQSSGTGSPGSLNGCVDCTPSSPSNMTELNGNAPGINNAFNTAALLANVATGDPAAWLPTASQCSGSSPPVNCGAVKKLAALANSLAACVNSASGSSAQCLELFDCATQGASFTSGTEGEAGTCTPGTGTTPASDTLAATLTIARNAGMVAIAGVYDVASQYLQFSPTLSAAPNDWTIALNFTGGGLDGPAGIAVDANGNVWVANNLPADGTDFDVTELSPTGTAISPTQGFIGGGLDYPGAIAVDGNGHVWVTNSFNGVSAGDSVTEINGTTLTNITGGGLDSPTAIAVDANGHVWVTNAGNNSVTEINGSTLSNITGGGLDGPDGIAVDANGHVWVTNTGNNSVTEINGSTLSDITGGGLNFPEGITVNASGDVWVTNGGDASVTEINGTTPSDITNITGGGLDAPVGIAVDANGNVWAANYAGYSVTELSPSGNALSPTDGFTGGGLAGPDGIAVDGSGNVWATNFNGNSGNDVTEFIGAAMPTVTPLVAQISGG